jgi:hypothetical protein
LSEQVQRLLAALALLGVLGGTLFVCSRNRPRPTVDGDLVVISQLRQAGSDLSKPHPIEFFLYLPSEQAALRVAESVREAGFQTEVVMGADGKNWLCRATKDMVPEHRALVEVRARFEKLASDFGGEYDGWETKVVR